ncbi:hypothetical protein QNK01_08270 [Desemzia incerta]|uniref:AbiJ-NTD4 domain-containing protein n=1 Tax=Desemzia incerta TaxID=82801 RepID=UPI0024C37554|nr:hypothetical protein [Desemzia incerta]WHZ31469.1 hypothetical protein QNK01_08270 [Desemzia incerta]
MEDVILIDSISDSLKNRFSNILYEVFEETVKISTYGTESFSWDLYRFLIEEFFKENITFSLSSRHHYTTYHEDVIQKLEELEWYMYYDLIEILAKVNLIDKNLKEKITRILEEEQSGYRLMENNEFVPITDEHSILTIDSASESPFEYAKTHLQNAISNLSEKENPDYNSVIREAINAVESCFIQVAGLQPNKKNTLGVAIKKIIDNHNNEIDLTFIKPFETMYGLASNNGIRHAGNEKTILSDLSDAILVLTTCSAIINYLSIKLILH